MCCPKLDTIASFQTKISREIERKRLADQKTDRQTGKKKMGKLTDGRMDK